MSSEFTWEGYGEDFWTENGSVTHRQSERSIAGHLHTMLKPESVVDVGCGTGQMLQMFKERGARVLGFESSNGVEWTQRLHIQECGQFIQAVDLRDHEAIPVVKDVDLVVCVEVAEHLPEQAARGMVYDICHRLNPRWLAFSGAVPRSPGGTGHINEQYFPYWKSRNRL